MALSVQHQLRADATEQDNESNYFLRADLKQLVPELWEIILVLLMPDTAEFEKSASFVQYEWLVYKFCSAGEHQAVVNVLEESFLTHVSAAAFLIGGRTEVEEIHASESRPPHLQKALDVRIQDLKRTASKWEGSDISKLGHYSKLWQGYREGLLKLSMIFAHLDRVMEDAELYCEDLDEHDTCRRPKYSGVVVLGLQLWYERVVQDVSNQVTSVILGRIADERKNRGWAPSSNTSYIPELKSAELESFRQYFESLVLVCEALGTAELEDQGQAQEIEKFQQRFKDMTCNFSSGNDVGLLTENQLRLYKELYELPMLDKTRKYFSGVGARVYEGIDLMEFIRVVHDHIFMSEVKAAENYVHVSTMSALEEVLLNALVAEHAQEVVSKLVPKLISQQNVEDLRRLYTLVSTLEDPRILLQEHLREQIYEAGTDAMKQFSVGTESCSAAGLSSWQGDAGLRTAEDAEKFVLASWSVYSRYRELVAEAFQSHGLFELALEQGCIQFINSVPRAPQHLAVFSNLVLGMNCGTQRLGDGELEEKFEKLTRLFRYLNEKQEFLRLYSNELARRLIRKCSISEQAEKTMLARIEDVCGTENTPRIEAMLSDLASSKELTVSFWKDKLRPRPENVGDFSAMVLQASSWPTPELVRSNSVQKGAYPEGLQGDQLLPDQFPRELSDPMVLFEAYYKETKEAKCRLSWQKGLSQVTLVAYLGLENTFDIVSNTDVAVFLLKFNEEEEITVAEGDRQMAEDLVKSSLLLPDNRSSKVRLNEKFKPPGKVVDLQHLQRRNGGCPESMSSKSSESTGSLKIQAELVRIMKRTECMSHQELVEQTILGLRSRCRYHAEAKAVKREIDYVLQQEFISRSPSIPEYYVYEP
ncbi:hypothetical protein NDN08_006206 [Rhodosorus marinus]|uniref:Cullin family profile domain-containing protein n=1 Tax=Rhodosorus marinus TaxID=101924 RepID=A0AAV8UK57_9RHOD|nr:hypothetical protein NDN08_006206 [Rhodosorus marinus]